VADLQERQTDLKRAGVTQPHHKSVEKDSYRYISFPVVSSIDETLLSMLSMTAKYDSEKVSISV